MDYRLTDRFLPIRRIDGSPFTGNGAYWGSIMRILAWRPYEVSEGNLDTAG